MTTDERFKGFPHGLEGFLTDLSTHNEKAWFDDHRAEYETFYREPGRAFVDSLAERLDALRPPNFVDPVSGSLFRIFRDTRFSKDKSPYKTHLAAIFREGGRSKGEGLGFYVHLDASGLTLGGGLHTFSKPVLAEYRDAVVDPIRGARLREALAAVTASGPYEVWGSTYKRVPSGYDPDHENAPLLLHSGLSAGVSTPWPPEIHSAAFLDYCFEHLGNLGPLVSWLAALRGA